MKINIENLTYILNNLDTFIILTMFEIELFEIELICNFICNFKFYSDKKLKGYNKYLNKNYLTNKRAEKLLPLFLYILQNIKTKYKDIYFIYNDFFIKCVEEEIKNQLSEIRYKKLKILQEKSK